MTPFWVLLISTYAAISICNVSGDIFRSTDKMIQLVELEEKLIKFLENYLNSETFADGDEKAEKLQRFLAKVKVAHEIASHDPEWTYNPINCFHLLRRYIEQWDDVIAKIVDDHATEAAMEFGDNVDGLKRDKYHWPSQSDLDGAMSALARLVTTYEVDLELLSQGRIHHIQSEPLTPEDMMTIGDFMYRADKMYEAAVMYNGTLTATLNSAHDLDLFAIYQRLQSSFFRFGAITLAIKTVSDALVKFPGNKKLSRTLDYYMTVTKEQKDVPFRYKSAYAFGQYGPGCHTNIALCYYPLYIAYLQEELKYKPKSKRLLRLLDHYNKTFEAHRHDPYTSYGKHNSRLMDIYTALCRGEVKNENRLSALYCEYQSTSVPIYRAKKEYLNIDPDIAVYHDIITDAESTWIKREGIKKLKASQIVGLEKDYSVNDAIRVSETAWLPDNETVLQRVSSRLQIITGLDIETRPVDSYSELYQVLNYGLGGMYQPHIDAAIGFRQQEITNPLSQFRKSGDRIATFGFYLNDVTYGGATVFPILQTRVAIEKGSAVFWWNLKRNGDIDMRMLHGGCPVLVGSKWFMNKWIRELGQTLLRPCLLDPKL